MVLEKPLSAWCSMKTMRTCPVSCLCLNPTAAEGVVAGVKVYVDVIFIGKNVGGVGLTLSEPNMLMSQHINLRDVRFRHKSPSNKSSMLSLLQVERLGFYSMTGVDSSVWNTNQKICKSTLKVFTLQ